MAIDSDLEMEGSRCEAANPALIITGSANLQVSEC